MGDKMCSRSVQPHSGVTSGMDKKRMANPVENGGDRIADAHEKSGILNQFLSKLNLLIL